MSLALGHVLLNHYRVVNLLGRGGFGAVYRAWDLHLNVPRALKENVDTSPAAQALFTQEAALLSRLSHPNLPKVYDTFTEPGQGQYLVMAFVDGQDLKEKLDQTGGPLPESQVLPWVLQVIDALEYLHTQQPPIVHRDIKPSNIRITPQGQAVLVDFGIARPLDPAGVTSGSARPVSPGYSPIEQYGYQPVDTRSDVYALGATLYTLLTGRIPPESIDRYGGTALIEPRKVNPAVSLSLEQAILRAVEIQGDRRFQSAAEFRVALLTKARPVLPAASSKWLWITGLLLVLLLGLGAGGRVLGLFGRSQAASPTVAGGTVAPVVAIVKTSTPAAFRTTSSPAPPVAPASLTPLVFPSPTPSLTWTPVPTPTPFPLGPLLPSPPQAISPKNAAQVSSLARLGKGKLNDMALSPGGDYLAVATSIGIYLYDPETFAEIRFIPLSVGMRMMAFSQDGKLLAAIHEDSSLQMWRTQDWTPRPLAESQVAHPSCLEFSPDGQILAVCTLQATFELRSATDGSLLRTLNVEGDSLGSPSFSPDGKVLATSATGGQVYIWQPETGKLLQTLQSGEFAPRLAFSPDGEWLVVSASHSVQFWRISDWSMTKKLESNSGGVVQFSPDGGWLAVGTASSNPWGTIELYGFPEGNPVATLEGFARGPFALAFTPDGQALVAASDDGTVRAWRLADEQPLAVVTGFSSGVLSLDFSPDGQYLATGANSPFGPSLPVQVWRVADGSHLYHLENLPYEGNYEYRVAFSPDGETLAVSYGTVELRRASDGSLLRTFPGQLDGVTSLDFSPDGAALAVGMTSGLVQVWNAADGSLVSSVEGHTENVSDVTFSPDGAMLASVGMDGTARLWNLSNGNLKYQLDLPLQSNHSIVFSPVVDVVVTGWSELFFWRISDGSVLQTVKNLGIRDSNYHAGYAYDLAFSPDGKLLAVATYDWYQGSLVELRDAADGHLLKILQGHNGLIYSLEFSPDGRFLASGSTDGTVILWGIMP